MAAYYNEFEPFAAEWLRNLIKAGVIAPGDVDERSIEEVTPDDVKSYTQVHFFAGIGIWSYALRLAGWPDEREVWTGSCPCQPFSEAGEGKGFNDERHLWPHFYRLIRERKPPVVFGEQVSGPSSYSWFDLVQGDLEALDYAFGCVPFAAACVGAPNLRERAYWMAHASGPRLQRRVQGWADQEREVEHGHAGRSGAIGQFWADVQWLDCKDGRQRPAQPCTFPLVDGSSGSVGRLRAYGNALNAQQAKEFIKIAMQYQP